MPKNEAYLFLNEEDPARILGVSGDDNAGTIRTAYLNKIKQYPPETCPEAFERIRDAYNALSDPHGRMRIMLQVADLEAPLLRLLDNQPKQRHFVGPEAWIDAMKIRSS